MLIERRSPISDKWATREINVSEEEMEAYLNGTPIQIAMPNVLLRDRAFILNGIHPEEFDLLEDT